MSEYNYKLKTHIGINEEPVLVSCADDGDDDFYVDEVIFNGVNVAGCLSQDVLDFLLLDWLACAEQDKKDKQAEDNELDVCF